MKQIELYHKILEIQHYIKIKMFGDTSLMEDMTYKAIDISCDIVINGIMNDDDMTDILSMVCRLLSHIAIDIPDVFVEYIENWNNYSKWDW